MNCKSMKSLSWTVLTTDSDCVLCSCLEKTRSDYVEFSNFNIDLIDRKMKRWCGHKEQHFVSTVHSDGSFFRVTFRSNDIYEAIGFEAFYQFTTFQGTTFTQV